jgi:hypothetical protein
MTPHCHHYAAPGDVLCADCRRQRCDDEAHDRGFFPFFDALHSLSDPLAELNSDIAAIAQHLTSRAQADIADITAREDVIRHLQRKLDLRGEAVRKYSTLAAAERARADGLARQLAGLQQQVNDLSAELAQRDDLAAGDGQRRDGLSTVDSTPGDVTPEHAGYNVLWARVDPITWRDIVWRWFRV